MACYLPPPTMLAVNGHVIDAVRLGFCQQDYCKHSQPISFNHDVMIGPTNGCNGLVAEYRTRNQRLRVRLTPDPLQATLSKLLTYYCVLRPTQPPTLSGTVNE